MRRSQTGSPFGTSRSTPKKRRLIKYSQRPGPYHAAQGGVLNPHRYPSYVIGQNVNLIADDVLLSRSDGMDGYESQPGTQRPLTVSAGANQAPASGVTSTTLVGTASSGTPGETIANYYWTQVSGPKNPVFANANAASTNVTGLVPGIYVFKLSAVGSSGDTGSSTVQVTAS